MKKIKILFIVCSALVMVSCASTQKDKNPENTAQNEATEKKVKENKKSDKKISKRGRLEYKAGKIVLKSHPRVGSYNIQAVDEQGRVIPVLSTNEEYTSSSFYLLSGKSVYKLAGGSGVKAKSQITSNGLSMLYQIQNVADVKLDFVCFKSNADLDEDMIKVIATVKNTSVRAQTYALKTILDTVLGEKSKYHFYTNEEVPITTEVLYRSNQKTQWIVSRNEKTSLQILLDGADITVPEFVAVANYSTLNTSDWEPNMLTVRTFDTVLSYNNSAVNITWDKMRLAPRDEKSVMFYLALATDANVTNGQYFLDIVEGRKEVKKQQSEEKEKVVIKPVEDYPVEESEKVVVTELPAVPPAKKIDYKNVKFDVNSITKEQLSPEYIQSLLDRIETLEMGDPYLNRDELLQLNAELDVILEKLRAQ